jgi:hypothetical protein
MQVVYLVPISSKVQLLASGRAAALIETNMLMNDSKRQFTIIHFVLGAMGDLFFNWDKAIAS